MGIVVYTVILMSARGPEVVGDVENGKHQVDEEL